jgi:hypothetical protein
MLAAVLLFAIDARFVFDSRAETSRPTRRTTGLANRRPALKLNPSLTRTLSHSDAQREIGATSRESER